MAGERTIPILPCRQLDDVLPFYAALGFVVTYRQARPNPYAVVERDDLALHFFGLADFDPEQSMGSAIVLVPDVDALHREFADGLRAAYGKVPLSGIWGEFDSTTYPHIQERIDLFRALQPDFEMNVIAGAGHWVAYEAAEAFNKKLIEVLSR